MLAADTDVKLRIYRLTKLDSHFHKFAYTCLVKLCKWIVLVNLSIIVSVEELAGIVILEKPNVICVRSLVPKQKKSASAAISSAVRAALGISIIVPTS